LEFRRHGRTDQGCMLELKLILIRGRGRGGCRSVAAGVGDFGHPSRAAIEMARVWPGDALAIDDVHPLSIGAEGDILWLVSSRNQACHLVGVLATEWDHSYGVRARINSVQSPAITRECDRESCRARVADARALAKSAQHTGRCTCIDFRNDYVAHGVDH